LNETYDDNTNKLTGKLISLCKTYTVLLNIFCQYNK